MRTTIGIATLIEARSGATIQTLVFYKGHLIKAAGPFEAPLFFVRDGAVYRNRSEQDIAQDAPLKVAACRKIGDTTFCIEHRCELSVCDCRKSIEENNRNGR